MKKQIAIEVVPVTIGALIISAMTVSRIHQNIFDSCMSPGSSVGLFGRIVIATSPIPSLFVIVKSRTQIYIKALLGVLVLAIVALFWFWMLRDPICS